MEDNNPVRCKISFFYVYQRCNISLCEHTYFKGAKLTQNWIATMKEDLFMIERNKTWELVD